MKVTCFNDLSLSQKVLILKEFGTFIHSVESKGNKVLLYSLNLHFVEVYCNYDSNQIEKISVADYQDLDKYMWLISLCEL